MQASQSVGILPFSLCNWQRISSVFTFLHISQTCGIMSLWLYFSSTRPLAKSFMSFWVSSLNLIPCPLLSLMYWETAGWVISKSSEISFCFIPRFRSSLASSDLMVGITYHTTISHGGLILITNSPYSKILIL